jgi:hypothetical protein
MANTMAIQLECRKTCGLCPYNVSAGPCEDMFPNDCPRFLEQGRCDQEPALMARQCRRSCGLCPSVDGGSAGLGCSRVCVPRLIKCMAPVGSCYDVQEAMCVRRALAGECVTNRTFMDTYCRMSCGHCSPTVPGIDGT